MGDNFISIKENIRSNKKSMPFQSSHLTALEWQFYKAEFMTILMDGNLKYLQCYDKNVLLPKPIVCCLYFDTWSNNKNIWKLSFLWLGAVPNWLYIWII